MPENWFSILPQLAIGLTWPVAILALAFLFRKGIRPRFNEARKVKYPGDSNTTEVNDPAETIEKKPER